MTLIRSGVKKIRVIDSEKVFLSSLNRHAFSFRSDIGKLKVNVVKEYAAKINPNIIIECIEEPFILENAEKSILIGSPSYVIDCTDDLNSKCDIIEFCERKALKIITSMGAVGKIDASCIRFSNFDLIKGEKEAKKLRLIYKKKFEKVIPNIKSVYSIEPLNENVTDSLLTDQEKKNVKMNFNETNPFIEKNTNKRSLGMFASIPAIFGQAIASVVLTELAGVKMQSLNEIDNKIAQEDLEKEKIGNVLISKLMDDFKKDEQKKNRLYIIFFLKAIYKLNNLNLNSIIIMSQIYSLFLNIMFTKYKFRIDIDLAYDDFLKIANTFNRQSSISQAPSLIVKFIRWDITKPISKNNIILLSKDEITKHKAINKTSDLITKYGKENHDKITEKLRSLN